MQTRCASVSARPCPHASVQHVRVTFDEMQPQRAREPAGPRARNPRRMAHRAAAARGFAPASSRIASSTAPTARSIESSGSCSSRPRHYPPRLVRYHTYTCVARAHPHPAHDRRIQRAHLEVGHRSHIRPARPRLRVRAHEHTPCAKRCTLRSTHTRTHTRTHTHTTHAAYTRTRA